MISVMRMVWFHLRQFARVGYFVGLLVSSTTSMFLLQLLAMRAATGPISGQDPQLWVRAALVGMWSVCTVSAGMIGFQRMQGTLVHVLFSPRSPIVTLGPIVAAGSCFGILAFPLAAGLAVVFHQPVGTINGFGLPLYWLACLSVSVVVAATFVFTRNAIAYEPLLLVPMIVLSGVFGSPLPQLATVGWMIPTSHAITVLTTPNIDPGRIVATLAVSAAWLASGGWLARIALQRATVAGTLEVA